MRVFLVKRTDRVSYDEYDSCVVLAESTEDVEAMIEKMYYDCGKRYYLLNDERKYLADDTMDYNDRGNHIITYIGESTLTEPQIICSSFNAG